MSQTTGERAAVISDKFELYIISLVFTLLGLSIQTAKFDSYVVLNFSELFGWIALLVSGVFGLWRMEYVPVVLQNLGRKENFENRVFELEKAKLQGGEKVYVALTATDLSCDELLTNLRNSIATLDPVIKEQEKSILLKYGVHRVLLVVGMACLLIARGGLPAIDAYKAILGG